jgi:hypothetical protein
LTFDPSLVAFRYDPQQQMSRTFSGTKRPYDHDAKPANDTAIVDDAEAVPRVVRGRTSSAIDTVSSESQTVSSKTSFLDRCARDAMWSICRFLALADCARLLAVCKACHDTIAAMNPLQFHHRWNGRLRIEDVLSGKGPLPSHVVALQLDHTGNNYREYTIETAANITIRMPHLTNLTIQIGGFGTNWFVHSWLPRRLRQLTLRLGPDVAEIQSCLDAIGHCTSLQTLSLCMQYTNHSRTPLGMLRFGVLSACIQLQSLAFRWSSVLLAMNDRELEKRLPGDMAAFIKNIRNQLTVLDLPTLPLDDLIGVLEPASMVRDCKQLFDSPSQLQLRSLARVAPQLTNLSVHDVESLEFLQYFRNCTEFTCIIDDDDDHQWVSMYHVECGLLQTPQLTSLDLTHHRIKSQFLETIVEKLPQLTSLGCESCELESLEWIRAGANRLRRIAIRQAGNMDPAELVHVMQLTCITSLTLIDSFDPAPGSFADALLKPPSRVLPTLQECWIYP